MTAENTNLKIYGDLAQTRKLESFTQDCKGGTFAPPEAEISQLFADFAAPPILEKLPEGMPPMMSDGFRDTREGPLWKRTYKLVGLDMGGGSSGSGKPRDKSNPIYGLQVTLEDLPLKVHPDIGYLISTYGGTLAEDGTIEFQRYLPGTGADGNPLVGGDKTKPSPMWGQKTFKSPSMVFTAKWFWKATDPLNPWPPQIYEAGCINTPAGAPSFGNGNRNWIYLGMSTRLVGLMNEIEESWLLSPPGGWFKDVYSIKALGGAV